MVAARRPASRPRNWRRDAVVVATMVLLTLVLWRPVARDAYNARRSIDVWRQELALSPYRRREFPHFIFYYPPACRADIPWMAALAEKSYRIETRDLAVYPQGSIPVVVEPSLTALNRSVGLPAQQGNLGLYWGGVIRILSPQAWLGEGRLVPRLYRRDGPLPHELGHALLNFKAEQNYPAWFNEGVAQWEDWHVTGYRWITLTNRLTGHVYSMRKISHAFYHLPNQALAYHEGLALVRFLHTMGKGRWHAFLAQLGSGIPFNRDLQETYHFSSPQRLFRVWRQRLADTQRMSADQHPVHSSP